MTEKEFAEWLVKMVELAEQLPDLLQILLNHGLFMLKIGFIIGSNVG